MLAVCVLLAAASALSNAGLPKQSTVLDRLSEVQKAQLSEVLHLRQIIGPQREVLARFARGV